MKVKAYYASPEKCSSVKKAQECLEDHKIEYELIPYGKLSRQQLLEILSYTEGGFADVLRRGMNYQKLSRLAGEKVEEMGTLELADFLLSNSRYLNQLLLVGNNRIQVGYNEEEMRKFIPKNKRVIAKKIFKKNLN